ncbi:hypothetical protein [Glaciecola sp. SC05]|uniref:hypothetical protein n=1 Tax=Glaciecola sp. SC05 TaxID=1987355 RepID=UPI003527AC7A
MGVFCFLLSACSEPSQPENVQAPPQAEPLLSLTELLNANDVKEALASAAKQDDQQAIADWQERLLEAAEQVNLLASELKLLSGEQGLMYLNFQGMKTNYQREFEEAFFGFGDVDEVYSRYPAFESLQKQSKDLVDKRDALIQSSAAQLSQQGIAPDIALQQARQQWQAMMQFPLNAGPSGEQ